MRRFHLSAAILVFLVSTLLQAFATSLVENPVFTPNPAVLRGQNVYLQHCSVCHSAKRLKPKAQPSLGPDLSGLFQSKSAGTEQSVRRIILNGGSRMPGFRYSVDADETDDLIAFLKSPASFFASGPSTPAESSTMAGLTGIVRTQAGKSLEGVAVSAQALGRTFSTTVYSDQNGYYFFPPLQGGRYEVWAQAVGFETGKAGIELSAKTAEQNFNLKTFPEIHKQMTGPEWMASLPSETPADRRMKQIFAHTCTASCHPANWVLQNRFDSSGWGKIIDVMERITIRGYMLEDNSPSNPAVYSLIQSYRKELVDYLTQVRGPNLIPFKNRPFARPVGEAAQVVITEYSLPTGDQPNNYRMHHNGSDWSEGTPSKIDAELAHDVAIGEDGDVWFSDYLSPDRTIGRLDPRTGHVTGYKLAWNGGIATQAHGLVADKQGRMWATNSTGLSDGMIFGFDPKKHTFLPFPKPRSFSPGIGPSISVDSKQNLWAVQDSGVIRLNPSTGEYTEFHGITKGGDPYGITVDSEDNCWFAQIAGDRLGIVNGRTGAISEVVLSLLDDEISQKDRDIGKRSGYETGKWSASGPLDRKGPRRLAADRRGNSVWVAEYWADRLAKVDIHTKKVTEYRLPHQFSLPYAIAVDKNHMVWINLLNSDRIARFDPSTEQFDEFPLPTIGTGTRFITVDDRTNVPTVWLPYNRVNKIARIEFRNGRTEQSKQ